MDSDIIDVVTDWDSTPFSGGYDGLRDLATQGFTGAISEGRAWAFVLNGNVIGVFDGDITAFEDADGTAYNAPDPALPLLYTMQETGGETRAQYYTNETPISSADGTLSSGNFTGYIELSENVLSGDYYVVYYGGKSMSVAWIGNSRKLLTGDEAFERADDEVGIYEVKESSIEVVDIPETESQATTASPVVDTEDAASDDLERNVTFDDGDDTDTEDVDASLSEAASGSEEATDDEATSTADEDTVDHTPQSADEQAPEAESVAEASEAAETDVAETDPTETDATETDVTSSATDAEERHSAAATPVETESEPSESTSESDRARESSADQPVPSAAPEDDDRADEDVFSEEAQWREAKSIPALDPKESAPETREGSTGTQNGSTTQQTVMRTRDQSRTERQPRQSQPESQRPDVGQLKTRLDAVTKAKSELEAERERLAAERDRAVEDRDRYREKAENLQSRVSTLEDEVEQLEAELDEKMGNPLLGELNAGAEGEGGQPESMTAEAALDGTNLFVRYGSKSGGTLEKAHAGEVNKPEVNENLRLEHHTGFETDGVFVDGSPYEEFLEESIEYGFVRWVVEELLYEIRETGNRGSLDELFDAIPKIDRAELQGNVTLKYMENGEEHREQQSFDVVLRDRMGNPLLVANLNGSREPASEGMMRSLVEHTSRLRESNESLGAAFLVTASYFAPEALETAADATGGGLLSRGRRKSYVKLSRKQGFHLCLVETRNGDFHVNVPEL